MVDRFLIILAGGGILGMLVFMALSFYLWKCEVRVIRQVRNLRLENAKLREKEEGLQEHQGKIDNGVHLLIKHMELQNERQKELLKTITKLQQENTTLKNLVTGLLRLTRARTTATQKPYTRAQWEALREHLTRNELSGISADDLEWDAETWNRLMDDVNQSGISQEN
jgi:hypothetical protein